MNQASRFKTVFLYLAKHGLNYTFYVNQFKIFLSYLTVLEPFLLNFLKSTASRFSGHPARLFAECVFALVHRVTRSTITKRNEGVLARGGGGGGGGGVGGRRGTNSKSFCHIFCRLNTLKWCRDKSDGDFRF